MYKNYDNCLSIELLYPAVKLEAYMYNLRVSNQVEFTQWF